MPDVSRSVVLFVVFLLLFPFSNLSLSLSVPGSFTSLSPLIVQFIHGFCGVQ